MNILITGATGNIGTEVIRYLYSLDEIPNIIAGVRNIDKAKKQLVDFTELSYVQFDFESPDTFESSLNNIDRVFLLRPPHISDIETYFKPLISKILEKGIREVMFLSVQGAEKSKVIPHNKIESLITNSGLKYIFIRPSYFMQNLTTTLYNDIKTKKKIILPSGKAKFNWIDIKNIAEASAVLLIKFNDYSNQAIEITGYENENFYFVEKTYNDIIPESIKYTPTNPIKFYRIKKKEGVVFGMIMVMIMLHFLPRFQKEPTISKFYEKLTGKEPTSLNEFIEREKEFFN